MLVGCGKTEGTNTKETGKTESGAQTETQAKAEPEKKEITFPLTETLNFTAMGVQPKSEYTYDDNIAWQYVRELTNVNFEMTGIVSSEAWEKMGLIMASGDYPEVIYKPAIDDKKYGMDGILIPLEDLIREYAPNLTAILDERNLWKSMEAPDGHIYSLPMIQKSFSKCDSMFYWINQEWLDKLNMAMPTNKDELYNVLKAFKENDMNGNGVQDEIPLVVPAGSHPYSFDNLLAYLGDGLYYGNHLMIMDGEMQYLPTTDYFKEDFLKYFKKLYDEGLINQDAFTASLDQVAAVGKGDKDIYGLIWGSSPSTMVNDEESEKWLALKPFDTNMFAINQGAQRNGLCITDKCKNPEIIIAWADFFYSEEGGRVLRMGVEGKSYTLNNDGTFTELEDNFEALVYQATFMGAAAVPGMVPEIYYSGQIDPATKHVNYELFAEGYGSQAVGVICPELLYTEEEEQENSIITTDTKQLVQNYIAEAITGLIDIDATWDDFQKTLKDMRIETFIENSRAGYKRAFAE